MNVIKKIYQNDDKDKGTLRNKLRRWKTDNTKHRIF